MSTFTYTIKYPDGRVEHHTGAVRKEPSVSPPKNDEEADAKIVTNAARVPRREPQFEIAATWLSTSPQTEAVQQSRKLSAFGAFLFATDPECAAAHRQG